MTIDVDTSEAAPSRKSTRHLQFQLSRTGTLRPREAIRSLRREVEVADDAIRLRVRSSHMCATCLSVYECYVRACACGERGPTGQISAAEGRPHRATKVEGRERNKTRKTRRAISSRRLAGHLRHPRKISLHQFSTVQSGRIRQENSEVRALRMVFLRNALLRLHHRRRWRRTTGSETRETASRAEPREEERSTTERKPAPRPRACRRFHSLLNHGTSEGIRILCVSSSTVGPGEAGRGAGGRGEYFATPSTR